MKKFLIALIFLSTTLFANTEIYKLNSFVNDFANVLTTEQKESLESRLRGYEANTSTQIVVLTVPSIEGYTLEEYSIDTAEANGIGQKGKDNGVLLLVNIGGREVRIEVGYGLEGVLSDMKSAQIIRNEIVPNFKSSNYYGGIKNGLNGIMATIGGFEPTAQSGATIVSPKGESFFESPNFYILIVFAIISILVALSYIKKYRLAPVQVYATFALFFAIKIFTYLMPSEDVAETIFVSVILGVLSMLFVMLGVPFLIAKIFGMNKNVKFILAKNSLLSREAKFKKVLKAYAKGRNAILKYENANTLMDNFDLFSTYDISNLNKAKSLVADDTKSFTSKNIDIALIDISRDENKREYSYAVFVEQEGVDMPLIYLYKVLRVGSEFSIVEKKLTENIDEIDKVRLDDKNELGIWALISTTVFVSADRGSSNNMGGFNGGGSFGSGGGFGGGGGGFGGGGSSGRW